MGDDSSSLWAVVVGVDAQQPVGAQGGRSFGQVDGVARVVGADARDDRRAVGLLGDGELDDAQVLGVVERGGLPGRAADDEAVRALADEVVHEVDERLLVDLPPLVERGDDRREDRAET